MCLLKLTSKKATRWWWPLLLPGSLRCFQQWGTLESLSALLHYISLHEKNCGKGSKWYLPRKLSLNTLSHLLSIIFIEFSCIHVVSHLSVFSNIHRASVCMCVHDQSCPTLLAPWTVALQAPLSMEFSRILEWVAISFSRGSSWLRNWTQVSCVSCIGRWEPLGKPHIYSVLNTLLYMDERIVIQQITDK